ncbi:hypothetical protein WJX72_010611 [[Myrmecia] bisecta]|uniref:Uncharacterized protein n=1 Tax=[Myrmecia] bisecta TaxID=41462 RepID=A0AAW1Q835_9CHLO
MEGPANELRAVQSLLWDHITSQLPSAEQAEVQRIVGSQLVEPNKALYKEATALADILGELRAQTDAGLQKRHRLCQHPQRELVEGELRMLISRLQDLRSPRVSRTDPPGSTSARKLSEDGSFTARSFSEGGQQATAGREWALRLYVASHVSQAVKGARPTTPRSPLSRPATASSRSMSRPSTALSAGSAGSGVDHQATLDAVRPSLNAMEADAIKERLREALAAEREALLEDVEYLQMCLEEETELHAQAQDAPPPLAELQTYSRKLQQELLEEEQRARHQAQVHRLLSGSLASPSSPPLGSSSSSPGHASQAGSGGQRAETKLQNKTNVLSMTASGIAARKNGKVR